MPPVKYCLYCNEILDPEWSRSDKLYCNESCKASYWYRKKTKKFYDERYKRQKAEWAISPNGKKAGMSFSAWRVLPAEWR